MQNFRDFFRNNDKNLDFLGKVCEPLKRAFGIDVFWSSTIHEDGKFDCLCSYDDAFGYFWENECYNDMAFYVAPSHLKSGYFLLDHDADYTKYMDNTHEKYPLYHPMLIIRKESKNRAKLFGFAAKKYNPALPSLYLNNLAILNSFFDYYFASQKEQMFQMDLAHLRGHDAFYKRQFGQDCFATPEAFSAFLKQLGLSMELLTAAKYLTVREKEVLSFCVDGSTAQETGEELGLSRRTVQFYLENVKNKLGILSREELLQYGRLLKMSGFLEV